MLSAANCAVSHERGLISSGQHRTTISSHATCPIGSPFQTKIQENAIITTQKREKQRGISLKASCTCTAFALGRGVSRVLWS
jgi:hypothetical protein